MGGGLGGRAAPVSDVTASALEVAGSHKMRYTNRRLTFLTLWITVLVESSVFLMKQPCDVMLTDTKDWSNEPVIYYQLTLIISTSFIPGLEDTNNDTYQQHNETIGGLVSTADSGSTLQC